MSFSGSTSGPSAGPSPSPSPGISPSTPSPSPGIDPEFGLPEFDPLDPDLDPDITLENGWSTGVLIDNTPGGSLPDVWEAMPPQVDPFTGQPPPDAPFDSFVGRNVDAFTNAILLSGDNSFTGGGPDDPYGGLQLANYVADGKNSTPSAGGAAAGTGGPGPIVDTKDLFDADGNWWTLYTYADGTRVLQPSVEDVSSGVVFKDNAIVGSRPQSQTPAQSVTPPTQLPPLPPPEQSLPPLPPPDAPPEPTLTTTEIVIEGTIPFSPDVSLPAALERAQGMGHIEVGDLKQFGKGAYNGLADLLSVAVGPVLGPAVGQLDIPKASIDPRYGGAAIVGEQFSQNLLLEGAGQLSTIGRLGARGLKTETLVIEHLGQDLVLSDEAWAQYQVHATGSQTEEVFRITENGKTRLFRADGIRNNYLVEAKEGAMGFWRNPLTWEDRIYNQARGYLQVADVMGFDGVRYAVSDANKVQGVTDLFTKWFPDAMNSGQLSVWWVPK